MFVVGGATFQEAALVSELNQASEGTKFVLGGTIVLNSKKFLNALDAKEDDVLL